ncbi:MAG: response regulator [Ignavibacteriota bacterium]
MTWRTFAGPAAFLQQSAQDVAGCILLDLNMPGMNGLELQEAILQAGHPQPVIFISGEGDVPATVRAMKAGAMDFLTKPFLPDQVLDAIRDALARDADLRVRRNDIQAAEGRFAELTPREREVAAMVARGMLNKQIAWQLGTSEKTIKVHRARVMDKLAVESVAELVRLVDRLAPGPSGAIPQ